MPLCFALEARPRPHVKNWRRGVGGGRGGRKERKEESKEGREEENAVQPAASLDIHNSYHQHMSSFKTAESASIFFFFFLEQRSADKPYNASV